MDFRTTCTVLLCSILAGGTAGEQGQRVDRAHRTGVAPGDEALVARPNETLAGRKESRRLAPAAAAEDLDELEWYLEDRFSYLTRTGVDYRSGLDSIRAALGGGIRLDDFAIQLDQLIARFGDGHARVRGMREAMPSGFLPFSVAESAGGIVAFLPGPRPVIDERHAFLRRIDGLDIESWIDAARPLVAAGSPQLIRQRALGRLTSIAHLRQIRGLPASPFAEVDLEDLGGRSRGALTMRLVQTPFAPRADRRARYERLESETGGEDLGHLTIPTFSDRADPTHVETIHEAMRVVRGTAGLIVDVRGNSGGGRAGLLSLFPYLMPDGAKPFVANAAVYRKSRAFRSDHLEARHMYRGDHPGWTDRERDAIDAFAKTFVPEWQFPREPFSDWHYLVLSRAADNESVYHYDRPVVVLMDGRCFSATDIFLGALAGWPGVTLVGTPSAGGSGRVRGVALSNSGLDVVLSSMCSFRPTGALYDGRGVDVDERVERRASDIFGQSDAQLDAAIARLSR